MAFAVINPFFQFFDNAGEPLDGGTVETYESGTSTPKVTYQDAGLTTPNTAAIELDSAGRCSMFVGDGETFKYILKDASGVTLDTKDGVKSPVGTQAGIGALLYPRTEAELAALVTPASYAYFPPTGVDVRRFGVIGNGITDDSAAMTLAISTGQPLDLGSLTIRIVTKLTFDQADQRIYARGGGFKFDGDTTTRIADITASGVEFHGVDFDGNDLQPKYALVLIDDDAARPVFRDCTFHDLLGTTELDTTPTNQMYAMIISPYGVTDLLIDGCTFRDITKHNDTATVTPTTGLGFCGGIFFGREDSDLSAAQAVPTSGTINGCSFRNIKTVIDSSLSESDRLNYDDADAIRIIGSSTVTQVPVKMTNLRFSDVSKRCFKISTSGGQHIENIHVEVSTSLAYGMASIAKLDNDCFVRNVRAIASSTRRFISAIQMQGELNCVVDGLYVSHCEAGYELSSQASTPFLRNIELRNALFQNVTENGYYQSTAGDQQENIVLENVRVIGSGTSARGFSGLSGTTDGNGGHKLRNCQAVNADVKLGGKNNEVHNMLVHISSSSYAGSASDRALVEIGLSTGGGGNNVVRGLRVYAPSITDNYTSATRTRLVLLYGDESVVDGVFVTVPDTMNVTYPSIEFGGDDCSVSNVVLRGPGFIKFGVFEAAVRSALRGATRLGNGATASHFVEIGATGCDDLILANIIDMRPTSGSTVLVNNAGGAYLIHGVQTRSSTGAVSDTGTKATVIDTQSV